jgi:predicted dehydrogenase
MIASMRVGLVGCGNWGRHILRDLISLGCEVPVVARSGASIERAATGGAAEVVATMSELEGLDGIVIATPTSTHLEGIREALVLEVPVFVEKPLCDDPLEARRLADEGRGRVFVMDKWRYHHGVLELAAIAAQKRLGTVHGLRTSRLGWGRAHDDVDSAWVLMPHDLAIALEVLGRIPTPLAAVGVRSEAGFSSLQGLLADDEGWLTVDVSERSVRRERRLELHCDDGVAVLEGGWESAITVTRVDCGTEPIGQGVDTPGELPLLAELRAFVEHLRGGPPPRSSVDEGALVVATIARLRELAGGN